ncbi:MAG TPA: putative glycoside hydrolase, partial [Gemmatimonadaceae bacterium]|nr:putative glycoside hydrolase [Gemmatimonadaceae bacterium]
MRTALAATVIALAACRGEPRSALATPAAPVAIALPAPARDTGRDSLKDSAAAAVKRAHPLLTDTGIVRALYVNRWAAQSARRMRELIAIADSTEINALVIDMKDEFGLNFASQDTMVSRNAGKAGKVPHLAALLDTLKAHGILAIARVVVFKDSVAARVNPQHVIRKPDGTPWRDKKGLTWVDPYDRVIWDYNIRVAEELAAMGFGEIQFDYIRFPEPYKSLPPQVFKDANGVPKAKALAQYFRAACPRVHAQGARCTADIFGLVASLHEALEVGQQWSELAPVTDVLEPMVYPSH